MANTSDGGNGDDPPDPSTAPITTDALSISTPLVHSAKNGLVPSQTDRYNQFFVHIDDDDDAADNKEDNALHSPPNTRIPPTDRLDSNVKDASNAHPTSSLQADAYAPNSWTKVLARHQRCQEPSYAATIVANTTNKTTRPIPPTTRPSKTTATATNIKNDTTMTDPDGFSTTEWDPSPWTQVHNSPASDIVTDTL
eukprot:CAMPEP_0201197402 /NCGR_PEP_ID=MMETSP0851-20130426/154697_1 /ASSEMBLY_ACC=CAM_ASM_000631 /TAXON_ID=183588 /ORGANISM="Pseudo-nitzschia fraudulenta, Strain WWA7" /LENGTH=195 /DNA_ID=CAMNT_0047484485 /DNA_START=13 /DNA_END=596 /DNA_ORIENTATION=-